MVGNTSAQAPQPLMASSYSSTSFNSGAIAHPSVTE